MLRQNSIRERFYPFSHTPGVKVLLPGTSLCLQVYPTTVSCFDLEGTQKDAFSLPLEGAISDFTVVQDLEQGAILIFGKDQKGFFRFRCTRDLEFKQEKEGAFQRTLFKPEVFFQAPSAVERLLHTSLQKRSVERLVEKQDWVQLLQPLYRLMQWYEPLTLDMPLALDAYILGGFEGLLVPTGQDAKKMGMPFSFPSPIQFLRALRNKVTSLFVEESGEELVLCPHIPQEMPAGRVKGVKMGDYTLDIEWRKKMPRRVQLSASKEKTFRIASNGLASVRLDKTQQPLSHPIEIAPKTPLFFDRFQKT